MAYRNGQLPLSALRNVAPGVQLVSAQANAYRSLVLVALLEGVRVAPAPGVGSGYRSIAIQRLFKAAEQGDKEARIKVGFNTTSSVPIATPGYSSHGLGNRIDLVFNGSASPNKTQLELAEDHGWSREFGARDENHFKHDGATAVSGPSDEMQNRIVAHYLNERNLGQHTATEKDGKHSTDPNKEQIYTWLLQTAGHKDGLYPTPLYKIDAKWGPRTAWLERYYWRKIWEG